jgi:hypothetical protein
MKSNIKWLTAVGLLALLGTASPARAGIIWYNGDFNGLDGLSNAQGNNVYGTNVATYDDFILTSTTTITGVFSHNLLNIGGAANDPIPTAFWEIRSGVSANNGGTVVAGGTDAATKTPTGNFGVFSAYDEYSIEVDGLNVTLGPGTYWLTVSPVLTTGGNSYNSTTSGANAVGSPPGNDQNAFLNAPDAGINFAPSSNFASDTLDFSMGIIGSEGPAAAPEPASLTMVVFGATGLLGYGWRRRKAQAAAND